MNEIMVSIVCCAYNHENYISKALDGFLMQKTSFSYEVIVHDDASTDGSAKIIHEYEKKHPGIIKAIYQKENQYSKGISITRTIVLPQTSGRYIALCEGDDYWTDCDKLQRQVDYLESHPDCSLVAHQAIRIKENGDYISSYYDGGHEADFDLDFNGVINHLDLFPTASMLFRKSFYDENKGILASVSSFDYVYKILLAASGYVHFFVKPMSAYRVSAKGSWSEKVLGIPCKFISHLKQSIEILDKINHYLDYKYNDAIQKEIVNRKYLIAEQEYDIKTLRQGEFKKIYKSKGLKHNLLLYVEKRQPRLYRLLRKIKRVWKRRRNI